MRPQRHRRQRHRRRRNRRQRNLRQRLFNCDWEVVIIAFFVICFVFIIGFCAGLELSKAKITKRVSIFDGSAKEKNKTLQNTEGCAFGGWPKEVPQISDTSLKDFCRKIYGGCNKKYGEGILFNERYEITQDQRRKKLEAMLSSSMDKRNDAVILMSVNYGYSWLFANWVCSLEHNLNQAQIENIKERTIVLVTDEKAQKAVNEMGFMTHYPAWLGHKLLSGISEKAPVSFGWGSHTEINALSIALLNDFIHLNHSVLMQDVDVVWNKYPINYLINISADLSMSHDNRFDDIGPGNSGFLFIKSNCKTKIFAQTLWNARSQVRVDSDQNLWNAMIDDKVFRQLHFHILDESLFANGHLITLARAHGGKLDPNHFVFHSSWTEDIFDKIEKFWNTEHFYYQADKCPYYDENMVVDVSARDAKNNRTKQQEAKFLKLGLFKNSNTESGHSNLLTSLLDKLF